MTIDTIMAILGSNVAVAIISYFTGRRQLNAQTDNQVLHNLEISVNLYKEIITDLKTQITELNTKVQELEVKIDDLMEENHNLRKKHIL
jgi:predicted  nucleic acid-binding Zn-ribbon protein